MQTRTILRSLFLLLLIAVPVIAAQVSRLTTFTDGSVLTASDLNSEFNNVISGINSINDSQVSATAAIDPKKLGSTIAGDGIARDSSTGVLAVNDDDTTLTISGDVLKVKDTGISATQLATSAVTSVKILDATIATADLAAASVTQAKLATLSLINTPATYASSEICRVDASDSTTSTSYQDFADCVLTTSGNRPVYFKLHPRTVADGTSGKIRVTGTSGTVLATIAVFEGATELFSVPFEITSGSGAVAGSFPAAIHVIRATPSAAAHTYTLKGKVNASGEEITVTGEFIVGEM